MLLLDKFSNSLLVRQRTIRRLGVKNQLGTHGMYEDDSAHLTNQTGQPSQDSQGCSKAIG